MPKPKPEFQSPLVAELYELFETLVLPQIKKNYGPMGQMLGLFITPILSELPTTMCGMDNDLELQKEIWNQLETCIERVKPLFLEYLKDAERTEKTGTGDGNKTGSAANRAEQNRPPDGPGEFSGTGDGEPQPSG